MKLDKQHNDYIEWINDIKSKIRTAQIKAALSANSELIRLYWDIGKDIFEKQELKGWGNSIVDSLSKDLKSEFPNMKGFSRRNLFYMKKFYNFYKNDFEKVQQFVAQIPWGHNILIMSKSNNIDEAIFYLNETLENNWSRDVLDMQTNQTYYFIRILIIVTGIIWLSACSGGDILPKPKAQLRLEYPQAVYQKADFKYFSLDKSNFAQIEHVSDKKINLVYPEMKAKIYLTYKPVNHNLEGLLRDAEKFTYEHTVKADEIITRDYINEKDSVYATINQVTGNAASQIQFHATDSIKHFLDGSLYFYAQPNYDSIMPAVKYLEKDVKRLVESLRWQ